MANSTTTKDSSGGVCSTQSSTLRRAVSMGVAQPDVKRADSEADDTDTENSGETNSPKKALKRSITFHDPLRRRHRDGKVTGLGQAAQRISIVQKPDELAGSAKVRYEKHGGDMPLKDDENYARAKEETRPLVLVIIGYWTAIKIFLFYLTSLSSLITVGVSVGMTFYWYERFQQDDSDQTGRMDWVLLGFAVITPLSLSVGMAFRRRERALIEISKFRSFSYQLFLSHCIWDWTSGGGRAGSDIDWVEHADNVLFELISIADEICRFLTLPTASQSRHRMTRSGRLEAARTAEVGYRLYTSLYTKRFVQLSNLSEKVKLAGLGASEASRIRQYERWMGDAIENLRMIKTYRTPQTLRSFARIFTTLMPPFFAPAYAQLALNVDSLAMGVCFAVITGLCLNALLEGVEILEDPFVAFVTLDGIDVREEFQVLHWQQLVSVRNDIFPEAMPYGGEKEVKFSVADDIETCVPEDDDIFDDDPPKDNVPKDHLSSSGRRGMMRRGTSVRFGDASILSSVENDIESNNRESSYQLCVADRARRDSRGKMTRRSSLAELMPSSLSTRNLFATEAK